MPPKKTGAKKANNKAKVTVKATVKTTTNTEEEEHEEEEQVEHEDDTEELPAETEEDNESEDEDTKANSSSPVKAKKASGSSKAAVESAENKERRALMSMISSAYADARGKEKSDIENMLRVYFLRQHSIALLPKIDEIRVYDDTAARIDLTVGLAGTNDGVLGFSADAYRFEFELEKDGDEWQLISARWGELGGEIR